jgi:putative FmdB family regulatory protein
MPLYIYVCEKCMKKFEVIVPLEQYDKKIPCKYCNKELVKKLSPVYFKVRG